MQSEAPNPPAATAGPARRGDGSLALAWGALEAGVGLVTGYPGAPSGTVFALLAEAGAEHGLRAEWCVNEHVALDMACGASQGGMRALVCVKGVGLNVALDTLMHLNLTGVHAGLVILLGDDPGAWGSGTDQDSRPLALLAEVPLLEPATPAEGRQMLRWAFDFSEAMRLVCIIRITRSYGQSPADLEALAAPKARPALRPDREPMRWVAARRNAVSNHRRLHLAVRQAAERFESSPFNQVVGSGPKGIVTGGFVHTKLAEALAGAETADLTLLKLGTLHPLPAATVARFLESVAEVLVLEEGDPVLEDALKTIGYDAGARCRIIGKRTGHVNWEGELFRWHIQAALDAYLPDFAPARRYTEAGWEAERPYRKTHIAGCPYVEILAAFREEAAALGQNPLLAADPCGAVMAPQYLDAKLSMGSAIGVAAGLRRAGVAERAVAITGDSNFYHSSLNALIQARATETDLLVMILDNGGALTTGGQATPDCGLPLPGGRRGPVIGLAELAAACGAEKTWIVEEADSEAQMRASFREALTWPGLGLMLVRKVCLPVG